MLILRSTLILAALSLLLSVLSAASSQVPDQLPPHAALPHAHSSLLANLDSSSSDSLKDLPQPLPFKIKRPRSLSTSEPTAISLERVQRNLGRQLAKRGQEASNTERVPFISRTAAASTGGNEQGGGGSARSTQRVTGGAGRGSVAAAHPVASTTQTVETGSKIVSTGLLTVASPSSAAAAGGTVTQVETASSGVLITSTASASSAAVSDITSASASAQAAEATSSTSVIGAAADARGKLSRMFVGGLAGAVAVLLVR